MKIQLNINESEKDYLPLKRAIFVMEQIDPMFIPGQITEAVRNGTIKHKRRGNGKRGRVFITLKDIQDFIKKNQK